MLGHSSFFLLRLVLFRGSYLSSTVYCHNRVLASLFESGVPSEDFVKSLFIYLFIFSK